MIKQRLSDLEIENCELRKIAEVRLIDRFAMAAMNGILSDTNIDLPPADLARVSYDIAQAMIEERDGRI